MAGRQWGGDAATDAGEDTAVEKKKNRQGGDAGGGKWVGHAGVVIRQGRGKGKKDEIWVKRASFMQFSASDTERAPRLHRCFT